MKIGIWLILGLIAWNAGAAKLDDPADALFGSSAVHSIHLKLTTEQWKAIEPIQRRQGGGGGPMPHMEYPVVHATVEYDGKNYDDVAMRYKGNSSFMMARNSLKKSIKLDFNDFVEKRTFFGLTTVNLNNNAGDPSASRETLAYELFAAAKVPAARTAMMRVELSVAGVYDHKFIGLYTMVEEVGKRFLKSRFGEVKGLLLKPDMARNLPYQGENWEDYKRLYVPKTQGSAKTQKRFIEFLKLVHQASDGEIEMKIEAMLDVDEFLRFLAINAMTSNLDSILSMGHNFYIYVPEKLGPMKFIPWDLNEAFGGFGMGSTPAMQQQLSLIHPHAGENKLIERLLSIPKFKQQYMKIVSELAGGAFSVPAMNARIDAMSKMTAELMAEEKKAGLTVGSPEDQEDLAAAGRVAVRLEMAADLDQEMGGSVAHREISDRAAMAVGPAVLDLMEVVRPIAAAVTTADQADLHAGQCAADQAAAWVVAPANRNSKPFVAARNQSIADQLAGKSKGEVPANNRFPGGGGPRGGMGGGGGFGQGPH